MNLPDELLDHIISSLVETEPPSKRYLHQEPSTALFQSDDTPLKNLSLTCTRLRRLCFDALFACLKVANTCEHVENLLEFVNSKEINIKIGSVLMHHGKDDRPPATVALRKKSDLSNTHAAVYLILEEINPEVITFVLTPEYIAELTGSGIELEDAWAFDIRLQVLQLHQARGSHSEEWPPRIHNILRSQPWNQLTFNEGSSLPAYSNYEYFDLKVPSILSPKREVTSWTWKLDFLTTFDYIATFPFHDFFLIRNTISKFPNLETFRTQFARGSDNLLNAPEREQGHYRHEPKDLWREFDRVYDDLLLWLETDRLPFGSSCLKEFIILDYACEGLRGTLDEITHGRLTGWEHDGSGQWFKKT